MQPALCSHCGAALLYVRVCMCLCLCSCVHVTCLAARCALTSSALSCLRAPSICLSVAAVAGCWRWLRLRLRLRLRLECVNECALVLVIV